MANRHAHKKQRAEVRARMASTGESYQKALTHILSRQVAGSSPQTDLVSFYYFGIPVTLATIQMHGMAVAVLVPSARWWRHGYPAQSPVPLMRAAMRSRGAA
jgi:hypothetical protein